MGDTWTIADALPEADLPAEIERLRRDHPRFKVEIDIAAQAVRLPDVLRGKASGVDVLFPNGSMALVDPLYRDSMAARIMNQIVGETVTEVSRLSGQKLRILEIGAGTGSTTAAVLRHLPAGADYSFTDVSSAFLAPARVAFAQHRIRFEVLDIESAANVRRLAAEPFDLILAANVLHATRDLRQTLNHVRSLLRPGGVVVLLEGTETLPITDITLGMLDGWWRHDDDVDRSSGPLLNRQQWQKVLHEAGFEAECLPTQPSFGGVTEQQTVVIARLQPTSQPSSSAIGSVTILHRDPVAAAPVRVALEAAGVLVQELSLAAGAPLDLEPPATQGVWLLLPARDADGADPVGNAETAFADLLTIAQAMLDLGGSAPALYVATSGAQPTNSAIRPGHAALWGAARVLASEAPGAAISLIDLDAEAPDWNVLARLIASGRSDPELVVTAGGVMTPSLGSAGLAAAPAGAAISPDASYIVTGAFGVLGAYAVRWLSEQGAGKLFLIGRHPPNAAATAAIEAAREAGTSVETVIADIGDAQDVAAAFARIEADPKPLRGIIHAAAALDDAPFSRQTSASFARAFGPKATGAWLLHQHSLRHRLDFFVVYSSVAALIGSAGQANYAASNAFIDALAHYRRSLGLPASSINWGLWAATGAAIRQDVVDIGTMQGAIPITPAQGQAVLARVIAGDAAQVAVMPIDRSLLRRALGSRRPPTLLQALLASEDVAVAAPASVLVADYVRRLETATGSARVSLLMDFVRKRSAELLNLDPSSAIDDDRPLLDLGLDSLVGLELRNDVQTLSGLKLPSTLFFDCPTLGELERYFQVVHPQRPPSDGETPSAALEHVFI